MSIWEIINTFGWPIGSLIVAVMAYHFEWIVSGKRFRRVERERERLLRVALGTTRVGERSASVAQRALDVLARQKGEADDDDDGD